MDDAQGMAYLKIDSASDRVEVAAILFKNGYTVSPVRKKRNGKSYDYYVGYQTRKSDIPGGDSGG